MGGDFPYSPLCGSAHELNTYLMSERTEEGTEEEMAEWIEHTERMADDHLFKQVFKNQLSQI